MKFKDTVNYLPNAYEEVEVLLSDGSIHKDMIVRERDGQKIIDDTDETPFDDTEPLVWRNYTDDIILGWRYIK